MTSASIRYAPPTTNNGRYLSLLYFYFSHIRFAYFPPTQDDVENACNAYNRAAALDESLEEPHLLWLNYAISLYTHGQAKEAEAKYRLFRSAVRVANWCCCGVR